MNREHWRVSLHGGHSSDFCDHAHHPLREMLEAAVAAGYHTFGVSEHAPRNHTRFLYTEEKKRGWDLATCHRNFAAYTTQINELAEEFADRLTVLRGFEAEVVPTATYVKQMREYCRQKDADSRRCFDYFVGSVHYVNEIAIDGTIANFKRAVAHCGSIEEFAICYYETVAEMIRTLKPDIVGHFDLLRRNLERAGYTLSDIETPRIAEARDFALVIAKAYDAALDLNTAGWRKGLAHPYPAPAIVRRAAQIGVPFCFGDDSHCTSDVGAGIEDARIYLLANGVNFVRVLTRSGKSITSKIVKRTVRLDT